MTQSDEFFPMDLLQDGCTFREILNSWTRRGNLVESTLNDLVQIMKEGLLLLKVSVSPLSQISEVSFKGKKIKLCQKEKEFGVALAKRTRLDLNLTQVMIKKFVTSWDTQPNFKESFIDLNVSSGSFRKDVVKGVLGLIRDEKSALLLLMTYAIQAKDDPTHPLQKPSQLIFDAFCIPSLVEDLLADLDSPGNTLQSVLSLLISLIEAKVPFSAQSKLRFTKWYFQNSRDAAESTFLDIPKSRSSIDGMFLRMLEMETLEFQCDQALGDPHWTVASAETTCSILEIALKSSTSDYNKLAFKALSLVSKALIQTFEEIPPTQPAPTRLYAFLLNPISILPEHTDEQASRYSVSEILDRRLSGYDWENVLASLQSAPFRHVLQSFASFLVASAVLEPASLSNCLGPYLACVGLVYRNNAGLCSQVWKSRPGSSPRSFLEIVEKTYPVHPGHLPTLLRNLSAGCASCVIQYITHLPWLTFQSAGDEMKHIRQSRGPFGDIFIEAQEDVIFSLPVSKEQSVSFTIPKSTRGVYLSSSSSTMSWIQTSDGWEFFSQVLEKAAIGSLDKSSIVLLKPIIDLFAELTPHLAITRDLNFVQSLIAIANTQIPDVWELQSGILLLLASILPLHPRLISSSLLDWARSLLNPEQTNLNLIFTRISAFYVQQSRRDASVDAILDNLGKMGLYFALERFRFFFGESSLDLLLKSRLSPSLAFEKSEPCFQILSKFVRLAQNPCAPRWIIDAFAGELSSRDKSFMYAHLFLSAINAAGPHLQSAVDLLADVLLMKLQLRQDPRFSELSLVRALLEHSNPQSPWIVVSLFNMLRPGTELELALSASKALGLLLATAESVDLNCLAGHIPDNHAQYGSGLMHLLRSKFTPLNLQTRLWYLLTVLATFQLELMAQLFPDASSLTDLILYHVSNWDVLSIKTPVACFLAAIWKRKWRSSTMMPLLSPKVWELIERQIRQSAPDIENCAANIHLLELVGHELTQANSSGWDRRFFKVVKSIADSRVVSSFFIRCLSLSSKPQGLDQLAATLKNAPAYAIPLQGSLLGALCSDTPGYIYDLAAAATDLSTSLAGYLAVADQAFYRDQLHGKLLVAWQRTAEVLFSQPEAHWSVGDVSYALALGGLIQGLFQEVEPIAKNKQLNNSVGALALGSLLESLLTQAARHQQKLLANLLAKKTEILVICARWGSYQRIVCPEQNAIALAQRLAWYRVVGRSMQIISQEEVPCNLASLIGVLEDELLRLFRGDFVYDLETLYMTLAVLLETILIILGMPKAHAKWNNRLPGQICNLLLDMKLPPLISYQILQFLLRSVTHCPVEAFPYETLAARFSHIFPLPLLTPLLPLSFAAWDKEGDLGLSYFIHASFLRILAHSKKKANMSLDYLLTLTEMISLLINVPRLTPPQLCLLESAIPFLLINDGALNHRITKTLLPRLLTRFLGNSGLQTLLPGHMMQLIREHTGSKIHDPMNFWVGEIVLLILGHLQREDHSGSLNLALTLDFSQDISFGSMVQVVKNYSASNHLHATLIVRAALGLLTSQLLLLISANDLEPLPLCHVAYDISQELLPHCPTQMSPELTPNWNELKNILQNPCFISYY